MSASLSVSRQAPKLQEGVADRGTMGSVHTKSLPAMYQTPSLNALYANEDLSDDPGPGAYESIACIGMQPESEKRSFPAVTMKTRSIPHKMWISKDHLQEFLSVGVPGSGTYKIPSSLSKRACPFSRGKKIADPDAGTPSPGPVYNVAGGVEDSLRASVKIGKEKRFPGDVSEHRLGPGSYESSTSLSHHKSKSFGNSFAEWQRVYLPGFDKFYKGTFSPGPGKDLRNFGGDRKGAKFTKDTNRSFYKASTTPGPASYKEHELFATSRLFCFNSEHKTPKGVSMGKPPRNPNRSDWIKMSKVQFRNSAWGYN